MNSFSNGMGKCCSAPILCFYFLLRTFSSHSLPILQCVPMANIVLAFEQNFSVNLKLSSQQYVMSYSVQDFSLWQRKMILFPGTQQLDIRMPFPDEIKYTILAISILLFLIAVGILIWQVQKCCAKVHYSKNSGKSCYMIRLWKILNNSAVKSWSVEFWSK